MSLMYSNTTVYAHHVGGFYADVDELSDMTQVLETNDVAQFKKYVAEILRTSFISFNDKAFTTLGDLGAYGIMGYMEGIRTQALNSVLNDEFTLAFTNEFYTCESKEQFDICTDMMADIKADDRGAFMEKFNLACAERLYIRSSIFNVCGEHCAEKIFLFLYAKRTSDQCKQQKHYCDRYATECVGEPLKSGKRSVVQSKIEPEKLNRLCVVPDSFYVRAFQNKRVTQHRGDIVNLAMLCGIPCSQSVEHFLVSDQNLSGFATMVKQFREGRKCCMNPSKLRRRIGLSGDWCPHDYSL